MAGPGYAPGTRMARMPDGTWVATSSQTGTPIENFVLVANPQAQGGHLVLRDHLPADWQPGMALVMTAPGEYETRPFQTDNAVGPYQYWDFSTGTGAGFDGDSTTTPPTDTTTPGRDTTPGGTPRHPDTGGTTTPPPVDGLIPDTTTGTPRHPGVPVQVDPIWQIRNPAGDGSMPPTGNARDEAERLLELFPNGIPGTPTIGRPADYGTGVPGGNIQGAPNSSPATYQYQYRPEFGMYAPTQLTGGSNPFYNAPNIPPPVQPGAPVGGPAVGGPQPFIPAPGVGGGAVPPGGVGIGGGGAAPPGLLGGGAQGQPPMPAGMTPQQYFAMYGVMPPGSPGATPPLGLLP